MVQPTSPSNPVPAVPNTRDPKEFPPLQKPVTPTQSDQEEFTVVKAESKSKKSLRDWCWVKG
jgi:hypothetical protein